MSRPQNAMYSDLPTPPSDSRSRHSTASPDPARYRRAQLDHNLDKRSASPRDAPVTLPLTPTSIRASLSPRPEAPPISSPSSAASRSVSQATSTFKEITNFFNYSPPKLKEADGHTDSDQTRAPRPRDMHLHSEDILKHVVYCPDLVDNLRVIADGALNERYSNGDLPPLGSWKLLQEWENSLKKHGSNITREASVVTYYSKTAGTEVPKLAATLELGYSTWSPGQLLWTVDPKKNTSKGVADGFLRFTPEGSSDSATTPLGLEYEKLLKGVDLVSWEFKNLRCGSQELMTAIMRLTNRGDFSWTRCQYIENNDRDRCLLRHVKANALDPKTLSIKREIGPDAPPHLVVCPAVLANIEKPVFWADIWPNLAIDSNHELKARHIVQQAWDQAVLNNTTFFVIQAGNYEIPCYRDRQKQTAYFGPLIEVFSSDYGRIQTGLYLAGIRDARIRFTEANARSGPTPPPEEEEEEDSSSRKEKLQEKTSEQTKLRTKICFTDKLLVSTPKNWLEKRPDWRHVPISDADYLRHPPYHRAGLDDIIQLHLTSRVEGGSGRVFIGTLQLGSDEFTGFPGVLPRVYVKIADDATTFADLQHEAMMYTLLAQNPRTRPFVPQCYGFFHRPLARSLTAILVLQDVGGSIRDVPRKLRKEQYYPAFQEALNAFHEAGILHRNLHSEHLLFRKYHRQLRVFLTSFARSKQLPRLSTEEYPDRNHLAKLRRAEERLKCEELSSMNGIFLSLCQEASQLPEPRVTSRVELYIPQYPHTVMEHIDESLLEE